jgi:hypothetical protein
MPRITFCKDPIEPMLVPSETRESHRKAAEALAHLSASACTQQEEPDETGDTLNTVEEIKMDGACVAERFPKTLWKVLSDENNVDVISWLSNGRGFTVYNRKKLISEVLPQYFKTKKYASFTRRLNRWGFGCYTKGKGSYVFHHPMFLRDQPELSLYMACSKKPTDIRRNSPPKVYFSQSPKMPRIISHADTSQSPHMFLNKIDGSSQIPPLSHMPKQFLVDHPIHLIPRTHLMNAYVASNHFFPEASSSRTKSIISNALQVLNQSDLKCLEILQEIKLTQYEQAHLSNNPNLVHPPARKFVGVRAFAA